MWQKDVDEFVKGALRTMLGVALILVGIVGLFVPFLPGMVLILLGAMLLGSNAARKILIAMREKIRGWWKR